MRPAIKLYVTYRDRSRRKQIMYVWCSAVADSSRVLWTVDALSEAMQIECELNFEVRTAPSLWLYHPFLKVYAVLRIANCHVLRTIDWCIVTLILRTRMTCTVEWINYQKISNVRNIRPILWLNKFHQN